MPWGGALSQWQKRQWVFKNVDKETRKELAKTMQICPQHTASLKWDPELQKHPRKCRKGPLCKKLHISCPENFEHEAVMAPQSFNLPHCSLFTRLSSKDVMLLERPPLQIALRHFWQVKLGLPAGEEVPIQSIEQVKLRPRGRRVVILNMKHQHGISSNALAKDKMSPGSHIEVATESGDRSIKFNISGKEKPKVFIHGAGPEQGLRIWKDRRLRSGLARPVGVYGYAFDSPNSAESVSFYDMGFCFVFRAAGATLDFHTWSSWQDVAGQRVPAGCMAFLRQQKKSGTVQWAVHEDGCEILQTRVDLDLLVRVLEEAS